MYNQIKPRLNSESIKFPVSDKDQTKISLPVFTGGPSEDLFDWAQAVESARTACEWSTEATFQKCKVLLRPPASLLVGKAQTWAALVDVLKSRYYPLSKFDVEYEKFTEMAQFPKEPVLEFEYRLFMTTSKLEFIDPASKPTEREQLHTFVHGLLPHLRTKVKEYAPANLTGAVIIATRIENARSTHSPSSSPTAYGSKNTHKPVTSPSPPNPSSTPSTRPSCSHCGRVGHKVDTCFQLHPEKRTVKRSANAATVTTLPIPPKRESLTLPLCLNGSQMPVRALLDSGANVSLISRKLALSQNIPILPLSSPLVINGFDSSPSSCTSGCSIILSHPQNPKLLSSTSFVVVVTDNLSSDLLLGLDFLIHEKVILNFDNLSVELFGAVIASSAQPITSVGVAGVNAVHSLDPDAALFLKSSPLPVPEISDFDLSSVPSFALPELQLLLESQRSSSACLSSVTHAIPVPEGTLPIYARPYRIPFAYLPALKELIEQLVRDGIMRPSSSPWASPGFVVPKKDGSIRPVVDYRKLNSVTVVARYPIPRMEDALLSLSGSTVFTSLDLQSGYYQIPMLEEDIPKTAVVFPFGQFEYLRMPFGLAAAPMTFQRAMNSIFASLPFVICYLDDILIHSVDAFAHQVHLTEVLLLLQKHGLKLNPQKCHFWQASIDYLGFSVSGSGVRPSRGSLDAIRKLVHLVPKTRKQLRSLVGSLNFLRLLIPNFAKRILPLTSMTASSVPLEWTPDLSALVQELVSEFETSAHLAHIKLGAPFSLYTDASDFAVGAVLIQDDCPVYFFSRKLSGAQCNYTVSEKECLAIVWALDHLRHVLVGSEITVFTDHSNLSFLNTSSLQRIQRWKLLIDEFDVTIRYIPGDTNSLADLLSRQAAALEADQSFPLSPVVIHSAQQADLFCQTTLSQLSSHPTSMVANHLKLLTVEGSSLLVHEALHAAYIPPPLRQSLLAWCHECFQHPGASKLISTIRPLVWWPSIRADVTRLTRACVPCAQYKGNSKPYAKLQPPASSHSPFSTVHVDMVGPRLFDTARLEEFDVSSDDIEFRYALTMIDASTRWVELVPLTSTTGAAVAKAFDDNWLCRYPRPTVVVTDQGTNFLGQEFSELLSSYGITHHKTSGYNPQSNGLIERVHGTLNDRIRLFRDPRWYINLPAIAWSLRSTFHRSLGASPGDLVFGRNMIYSHVTIDRPTSIATAARIRATQQTSDLTKTNSSRVAHSYAPGNHIFLKTINPSKTQPRFSGPFEILEVSPANNTLSYRDASGHSVRVNFRRVKPAP